MDLETFITAVFCLADDFVRDLTRAGRLRRRGPEPVLADSEVLTIEAVGEFLGLDTDQALHAYFRRHFAEFFPGLRTVHRTTLAGRRRTSGWSRSPSGSASRRPLGRTRRSPSSTACPCRSAASPAPTAAGLPRAGRLRARRARAPDLLRAAAAPARRLARRITAATLAPANEADRAVAPQLLAGLEGWALGDGGYWSPALRAELATHGLDLIAPARGKTAQAAPWPAWLVQTRRRIETVLSQLTERYHAKQTRARDEWHLAARWARKFVSHTIAVLFCQRAGHSALAFAQLLRA